MHDLMGAILAGGLSSRMGRDKTTLTLNRAEGSIRMLDAVGNTLRRVCEQVAVVRPAMASTEREPDSQNYRTVVDLRPHAGPVGGIEALLASNLAREYIVCPCDVPCITSEVLLLLLQHRAAPATVLRIVGQSDFEPLPARIAAAALPTVRHLLDSGRRSVWHLMQELPASIVDIDARHAAALRNVNTPDDLNTI